jgi:hypothetical protein
MMMKIESSRFAAIKQRVLFLIIAAAALIGLSCDDMLGNTGNLVFHAYLDGYTRTGGIVFEIELDHTSKDISETESFSMDDENYGYGLIPDMEAGLYDLRVSYYDGDDELGSSESVTVESLPGDNTKTTIDAVWSDGELTFNISTGGADLETTMEMEKSEFMVVAKMYGSSTEPTVHTNVFAFGNFVDAAYASVNYPDGFTGSVSTKDMGGNFYISVDDHSIISGRNDYFETGECKLTVEDKNGITITAEDKLKIGEDEDFMPVSLQHEDSIAMGTDPIFWSNGNSDNVETVAVVFVDELDTTNLLSYKIVNDPQSTSSITSPSIGAGTYYVIIMSTDIKITDDLINAIDDYGYNNLEINFARYAEDTISGFTYHMIQVTGS